MYLAHSKHLIKHPDDPILSPIIFIQSFKAILLDHLTVIVLNLVLYLIVMELKLLKSFNNPFPALL